MPAAPVSVVIVNYNGGTLLERCVLTVLGSDYPAIARVIVSDNGSGDESLLAIRDIAKTDTRVQVIENGANIGFSAANNRALPFIASGYILFLNPDCMVEPATISRMVEAMSAHPDAGMAGCLVRNRDGSEQRGCRRDLPTPASALARVIRLDYLFPGHGYGFDHAGSPLPSGPVEVQAISGAFMFVRKQALDAVGPLDEGYFLHCEDLDWCMRFGKAGWKILFVPGAFATHVQGTGSRSSPVRVELYKHRGMLRFYNKFYRGQYPFPLLWLVTLAVWLRFAAVAVALQFSPRHSPEK